MNAADQTATNSTVTDSDFDMFGTPAALPFVKVEIVRGAVEGSTQHWNNVKALNANLKAARTARTGRDQS